MKSLVSIVVVLLLLFGVLLWPRRIEQVRQGQITGGEVRSLLATVLVHARRDHYLSVGTHTFHNVLGAPPYFIALTNLDAILFVTKKPSQNAQIHVYDLGRKEHFALNGGDTLFGHMIGGQPEPPSRSWDYVESVTSSNIVIVSESWHLRERYLLDLTTRTFGKVSEERIR
jgi:hypothetical protein